MAITTRQQRVQRRNEALKLIADGVPPTDAASQLTAKWGCSRRTSLRDIEIAQSELANALNSVELQQMVGWLATQYQRLAAKAERDGQYSQHRHWDTGAATHVLSHPLVIRWFYASQRVITVPS